MKLVVGVRGRFELPGFELEREPSKPVVAYEKATGQRYVIEEAAKLLILWPLDAEMHPVTGELGYSCDLLDESRVLRFPKDEVML